MREIIIDRMREIVEHTYMGTRIRDKHYKDMWVLFATIETMSDSVLVKYYERFLCVYFKQM